LITPEYLCTVHLDFEAFSSKSGMLALDDQMWHQLYTL